MKTTAGNISKTLKAAGLPRAGRYTAWGYTEGGFISMAAHSGNGDVLVLFTVQREAGREMYERALEVLTEAGFPAVPDGRPGVGGTYSIRVPA